MSQEETVIISMEFSFQTLESEGTKILRAVATDMHRLVYAECEKP